MIIEEVSAEEVELMSPITDEAKNKPPFDPTVTTNDGTGRRIRYINTPLDQVYLTPPPDAVPLGMLPPEEYEIQTALVELKFFTERVISFGFFGRLFNRSAYSKALEIARKKQSVLRQLVKRSPEHKAALQRIVSAMPTDNGGREAPNRTGDVKGMSEAGYADSEIDKWPLPDERLAMAAASVVGSICWLSLWVLGWGVLQMVVILPLIFVLLPLITAMPNRYVVASGAIVVAFLTLTFTIGTVRTDFADAAGTVVRKWEEYRGGGSEVPVLVKLVEVVSEEPKSIRFQAHHLTSAEYTALRVGEQIRIRYHVESSLGLFGHRYILESINSHPVCGGSLSFTGCHWEKLLYLTTLIVGFFPLSYLAYLHKIKHRSP